MDFMNFMNQLGSSGLGCGNTVGDCNFLNNNACGSNILPFLLLSGLNHNSRNSIGNMTCYPNCQSQPQQYVTQTSAPCYELPVKYRTRKVRQAYMEVPVSTYQVVQPYSYVSHQHPINFNMIPAQNNGNYSTDLYTLLLILCLANRFGKQQICHPMPQPRGGSCSTTEL